MYVAIASTVADELKEQWQAIIVNITAWRAYTLILIDGRRWNGARNICDGYRLDYHVKEGIWIFEAVRPETSAIWYDKLQ